MKALTPATLVNLAVTVGDTTPVPSGGAGSLIWSTTAATPLVWDGSNWVRVSPGGGSGDVVGPGIASDRAIAIFNGTSGKLLASTGAFVDGSSNGVFNGAMLAAAGVDPSAPSSSYGLIYTRTLAGRTVPRFRGPSGASYSLSPLLGGSNIRCWKGAATTNATTYASQIGTMPYTGASPTAPTIPALASTNLLTQTRRSTISTGATAGGLAYIRANQTEVWRGNVAGLGGFLVIHRFALSGTLQSGLRAFAGLVDVVANPTNVDPTSMTAPGGIGLACAANTGNWKLVNNGTGTARTSTDLGANFPVNNTDLLELALFCAPNDSGVSYQATNLLTGNTATGTLTTNIPANTSFLAPTVWVTNNATAAAQTLDFVSTYVETDY